MVNNSKYELNRHNINHISISIKQYSRVTYRELSLDETVFGEFTVLKSIKRN